MVVFEFPHIQTDKCTRLQTICLFQVQRFTKNLYPLRFGLDHCISFRCVDLAIMRPNPERLCTVKDLFACTPVTCGWIIQHLRSKVINLHNFINLKLHLLLSCVRIDSIITVIYLFNFQSFLLFSCLFFPLFCEDVFDRCAASTAITFFFFVTDQNLSLFGFFLCRFQSTNCSGEDGAQFKRDVRRVGRQQPNIILYKLHTALYGCC